MSNRPRMIDSPSGERFFPRFPLSRVWVANLVHQFIKTAAEHELHQNTTPRRQLTPTAHICQNGVSNQAKNLTYHSLTGKPSRVRTKTVKKSAKVVIERYYPRLTLGKSCETPPNPCSVNTCQTSRPTSESAMKSLSSPASACATRYARSHSLEELGHLWLTADTSDCRLHHSPDEAHSAWSRPRYLLQAPGGGA